MFRVRIVSAPGRKEVVPGWNEVFSQLERLCSELGSWIVPVREGLLRRRDSALYRALGYVRKSDRKSGLTRKGTQPAVDANAA